MATMDRPGQAPATGSGMGGAQRPGQNGDEYTRHFRDSYQKSRYFRSGNEWNDYEPAYQYGYDSYQKYRGRKFDEVESDLERGWDKTKRNSRLMWNDAKEAIRDGWNWLERKMPGDADRDGR